MLLRRVHTWVAGGLLLALLSITQFSVSAHALSAKECSVQYKAAQSAGTLNGMKWNEFRKTHCSANAAETTQPAKSAAPATPQLLPAGRAVFPTAVSPKYASESAGKARMHTCRDQYNANKVSNSNGGLRWIQKGGGYYSECNKRLKG